MLQTIFAVIEQMYTELLLAYKHITKDISLNLLMMNNVRAKNRVCNRERVPFNTRTLIFFLEDLL